MDSPTKHLIDANARLHRQLMVAKTALRLVHNQLYHITVEDFELCFEHGDPQETIVAALRELGDTP